ncbi:MAG TPA: winged helix-turn-helix domain-containing protein, partial [Terriglobia bacterium]|nr:winged helix-turn-helix domain-containing protein [Terriglobia bacterium]
MVEEVRRNIRGFRFGVFELDLQARELRRRGLKVRLQQKPLQILELLLEKAGEVVTRKELREKLWPDTFVGF